MYEKVDACPLCDHRNFQNFLVVKDYLVSDESFALVKCKKCDFIFTNPRPDAQQIGRFYQSENYTSHNKDSLSLIDRVYYLVRYFTLRQKLHWIKELNGKKGSLLDFGCGVGSFIALANQKGWEAWGIESSSKAREIANRNGDTRAYQQWQDLPVKRFDVITLWHVLEHLPDLGQALNDIKRHLTTSGLLIIAVPNHTSYDASYYQEFWAGYDVPRHFYHFSPENISLLAKKHRLHLQKTIPLKFDAYYVSMLSEKYKNGSLLNALAQGHKSNQWAKNHHQKYSSLAYVLRK